MWEPFLEDESSAQALPATSLEQENAMLRSQLADCQKQLAALHSRLTEMENTCAALTGAVTGQDHAESHPQASIPEHRLLELQQTLDRLVEERLQAEQNRVDELAKANEVLRRSLSWLAREGDLSYFLEQILLEIASTVQADLAHLFVLHESERTLEIVARVIDGQLSKQGTPTEPTLFAAPFSVEITPIFRIMEEQDLFLTMDVLSMQPELRELTWPDNYEWHLREGRKQIGALVLKAGDRSVGFLGLGFRNYREMSQQSRELVLALANQAALAIQLTRLAEEAKQAALAKLNEVHALEREQAAQQQAAELARANSLLRNSLSRLSTNPNLNDILGHLLVEVVRYAGAAVGHIFMHDPNENVLALKVRCQGEQAYWTPADDEPLLFRSPIPLERTPIFNHLCAQPRLAVLNVDAFNGHLWQGVPEWFQAKGYQGTSACVLMVGDRPFGMLAMAFPQAIAFSSVEEELILALTQQIALVIQLTILGEADKQAAVAKLNETIAREQEQAAQERATELEQINAELQQSKTRLQDLIRTMSDWAWEVDVNGVYTYADEKVYEVLGYLPEEILGRTPFDLMPPGEAVRVAHEFAQIAAKQKPFRKLENLNLAKDGRPVILETSGTPIFDLQGNFVGYRGVDSDITERKRAEAALRQSEIQLAQKAQELQQAIDRLSQSEERYRTLFELSSEGIYRWELDQPLPITLPIAAQVSWIHQHSRIAEANTAYAAIYGFVKVEDVVGLRLLAHADAPGTDQKLAYVRHFIESGYRIHDAESEEVDYQGSRQFFLNNGIGIIENGYLVGGWGTQIDITELRNIQQALLQAEQQRAAELAKANQALTRSLNAIAIDSDPNQIISNILKVVAEQFDTPLVEYWLHSDCNRTAHLKLTHWNGQILTPAEQPGHPGNVAFPTLLSLACPDNLQHPSCFSIEDVATDPMIQAASAQIGIDASAWFTARGVRKLLNIPLRLNEKTIGALDIWLPGDRHFSELQVELGYAFAQQMTLASYLNQLFEEAKQTAIFEERNRLAGEIHDTLAQSFTGIAVQLELVKFLVEQSSPDITPTLDRIGELAQTGLAEARRSIWTLYPAAEDYADLAQQLSYCLTQMTSGTSLKTNVTINGEARPLPPFIGKNLLRIGQEAITNTLKYAQATHLWIELTYAPDYVSLGIRDDGCGFDPQAPSDGFGLIGMSERADRVGGQFTITTQLRQGTEVYIQVSLPHSRS